MNYLQLIQEVAAIKQGEKPSSFAEASDDDYLKIRTEINNTLRDFYLGYKWAFRDESTATFDTVIDQQAYNITWNGTISEDGVLYSPDGINNYSLIYDDNYNNFIRNTADKGRPAKYTIKKNQIVLSPTPNEVKTITVIYLNSNCAKASTGTEKTLLTIETDEPNFPADFHYILVYGALVKLFYNDLVRQKIYKEAYADFYGTILKESEKAVDAQPKLIFINTDW